MKRIFRIFVFMLLLACWLGVRAEAAEVKEEKEERRLNIIKPEKKFLPAGLTIKTAVFGGYDSNPNLAPERKGDIFEEFLFSLGFNKRLINKLRFTFDYDLDVLNYNDITSASDILNHLRFGLHDKFGAFRTGAGYDLAIVYFRNNDDDFFFHRGFAYFGQDINRKTYHQVQFEYGIKDYTDQKALGDTIFTYQSKDRFDRRWSGVYSIDTFLTPKLSVGFLTRFSLNDSNDRYQNFYDYKSYQGYPYVEYALLNNLRLLVGFSYTRKNYDKRRVTFGTDKEKDDLYMAKASLKYNLGKNNALSLNYTYRDNSSNEDLEKYTENVISAGWHYNF